MPSNEELIVVSVVSVRGWLGVKLESKVVKNCCGEDVLEIPGFLLSSSVGMFRLRSSFMCFEVWNTMRWREFEEECSYVAKSGAGSFSRTECFRIVDNTELDWMGVA